MNVLQANMHRSKTADALLTQMITERHYDLVIISEQYKKKENGIWIEDSSGTAAIWVPPGSSMHISEKGYGHGYVWARHNHIKIISCYLTPSDSIQDFQDKLDDIEDTAMNLEGPFLMAGDLNSRATEWGMPNTDSRGKRVLEMSARLGLIVLNTGAATTFRRPGCEETTPDITLASEGIAGTIKEWKVLEDYTGSDHQYISFIIDSTNDGLRTKMQCSTRKWNVSKLNRKALLSELDAHGSEDSSYKNAMETVEITMKMISSACNKAMPKTGSNRHKRPAYWWTENIAQLRRTTPSCASKHVQCLPQERNIPRNLEKAAARLNQQRKGKP
ncbi:PREDICTED: uncharacterized protein LOC108366672 [Rhagoletis zephyria]|uniref:uncharacterized protein LOC108366672 n=1 Tax=Rhagoletis zephyria TaxID=28612 RepID=UPI0008113EF2|nr:PREDICTED: uncharacterized protein LOC108366672 [Rhagoletis zephyria]